MMANDPLAEQGKRARLNALGKSGYTGTFDMQLIHDMTGKSTAEAKDMANDALDKYSKLHPGMRRKNADAQRAAIRNAVSVEELQLAISNFILSASGDSVLR